MNRKLYDETQQYKERSCDQRQQIDNFHILFAENKQESERSLALLRKDLDEARARERRLQAALDCKAQESYQVTARSSLPFSLCYVVLYSLTPLISAQSEMYCN